MEMFEDLIKLKLPVVEISEGDLAWKPYNPRKDIRRYGVSITSLDGGSSGVPDLDSLFEYNKLNGTNFREPDFRVPTDQAKPFGFLFDEFPIGRSHFLKLGSGGFFPYHRDLDFSCIRLIYCIAGCQPTNLVWTLEDRVLKLENTSWYFVNTKKVHSVFSFFGSTFAVFNLIRQPETELKLSRLMEIN